MNAQSRMAKFVPAETGLVTAAPHSWELHSNQWLQRRDQIEKDIKNSSIAVSLKDTPHLISASQLHKLGILSQLHIADQ